MSAEAAEPDRASSRRWLVATALLFLTFASTVYAGARYAAGRDPATLGELAAGLSFGLPLMSILVGHELGHFVVARLHGVPTSPPYFLPMPPQIFVVGTMGAVISVREPVRSRNVLVDFAIAGPLAGLVISAIVLSIGLAESPVGPVKTPSLLEGRSLLYLALLRLVKGPIPAGMDVELSPTAFAGWVGLLVTMINLVPCGQLDGGHVAEAALGPGYARFSRRIMGALCVLGLVVAGLGVGRLLSLGHPLSRAAQGIGEGMPWLVWCALQALIERLTRARGDEHDPQTEALVASEPLTLARRGLVALAGVCFVLLFMPWWMRELP